MRQSAVKNQIKNGAISLLTKKQLVEITVTDLVKEAGVARASFYRVYTNIGQVFDDIAMDLANNFNTGILQYIIANNKDAVDEKTISFLKKYRDGESLIFKMLPENFGLLVPKLVNIILKENENLSSEGKYIMTLIFIDVSAVARVWEKGGFIETPEQIAEILYKTLGREALVVLK